MFPLPSSQKKPVDKLNDNVLEYARETLSLGLLLLEFKDAIKEGDGTRVLRCWKYFLIIFWATGHKYYCIEAFIFLMQYYYTLPPRHAEQMLKKKHSSGSSYGAFEPSYQRCS